METIIETPEIEGEVTGEVPEITGEEVAADQEAIETEPEKEPTIKDLMAEIENNKVQIEKANKRTQYLQRKYSKQGPAQSNEPPKAKPDEDDYETNAEYVEAFTKYTVDQNDRQKAETRTAQEKKEREEEFFSVIDNGTEKYKDFNEVARVLPKDGGPTITGEMLETMMDSDIAVDVAYYLGKNVKESLRIANLAPLGQAREIGKIEAKLAGKTIPQKTSKTVTPSKPIDGKTIVNTELDNMSTKDFMSSRNQKYGVT